MLPGYIVTETGYSRGILRPVSKCGALRSTESDTPADSGRIGRRVVLRTLQSQSSRCTIGQLMEKPALPNGLPPGPVIRPS